MKSMSLHKILQRVLIIAIAVPSIVMGAVLINQNVTKSYNDFIAAGQTRLSILNTSITLFDNENRRLLELFSTHAAVTKSPETSFDSWSINIAIQTIEKNYQTRGRLVLELVNGRTYTALLNRLEQAQNYNPSVEGWYRSAIEEPGVIFLTESNNSFMWPGESELIYSKGVIDAKTGEVIGVAAFHVKKNAILEAIKANLQNFSGSIALMSRYKTTPIFLVENGDINIENIKKTALIDEKEVVFKKQKYKVFIQNNEATLWNIVLLMPKEDLNREQTTFIVSILGITLTIMVSSVFIARAIEQYLIGFIDQLVPTLKNITAKKTEESIEENQYIPEEMRLIKESVNQIAEEVNGKISELIIQKQEISERHETFLKLYEQNSKANAELDDKITILQDSYKQTLLVLAEAIESREDYAQGHGDRVRWYAVKLGTAIGLSEEQLDTLEMACILHDIGKITVPQSLLNKEASLTDQEFECIKRHSGTGHSMIKDIPYLQKVSMIILQHHEWFDGSGYPGQVRAEDIALEARIICIAEAYDAMTSTRAYRKTSISSDKAIIELNRCKGTQFDPDLVDRFIAGL